MKLKQTLLLVMAVLAMNISLNAQDKNWPVVTKESKPWTRWWWMGSAVDEKNLSALLETYHKAGIGGVEIAPIYGAKGYENRYIEYLSPKWMQMLDYTVQKAGDLNMGVDLTNGTGWPFGGPQVSAEYAAAKLLVRTYELQAGKRLAEPIRVTDPKAGFAKLQSLTAYGDNGQVIILNEFLDAEGRLNWSPKSGSWTLYAVFSGRTRQMVKRAAPGGQGFTLNHFSRQALDQYLNRYDEAFKGRSPHVRAFYNDSYEVYNADWSDNFFETFKQKRGYDLKLYIRELTSKDTTSKEVARVKSDYRETMAEMLLQNFTRPWTNWAHQYQAVSKNQAHGSPGNLLDLYAAVDIPECETFGSSYFPIPGLRRDSADIRNVDPDPVMLKFASSAGHVAGHNLVSCETFTWLTEHFKTSLSQMKPEVEQVFLSGVNHVFFHGTTYSPADVKWPGWLFYASVNMVPSNSFWQHVPALNEYITRVQSVLQAGKPDNELLIYWPVYDVWNNPKGMDMPLKVHDIDEWLHPTPFYQNVTELQKSGYSLDFISDHLLKASAAEKGHIRTSAGASAYQVLVVPRADIIPVETLRKMIDLARTGATVIFQSLPKDVEGLNKLDQRRKEQADLLSELVFSDLKHGVRIAKTGSGQILLADDVKKALEMNRLYGEKLTESGLKFIRRKADDGKYYYLVNHTNHPVDQVVPLNVAARSVVILDPQTGRSGLADASVSDSVTSVRVQLKPGEAWILKTSPADLGTQPQWKYLGTPLKPVELNGKWRLHFTQGGPQLPADRNLSELKFWTALNDSLANSFSGTAEYTLNFKMPKIKADEFMLDLGQVRESARVWINGQEVGTLWSIPFHIPVGKYLKPGKQNTIRIEAANLMANRIRDMDRKGIQWRNYHEINFVNINYASFDASGWQVQPSGLSGPVTITPYRSR